MKKLLCCFIILCLSVCSFSTIQAVEVENDNVDIMAVAAAMYIKGETSLKFSWWLRRVVLPTVQCS